jgi:hypothetical protein
MNLRLTSLLCGIGLLAAVPVLADRMPDSGHTNDSASAEIIPAVTNGHGVRRNAPLEAGFPAAPSAVAPIDRSDANNAADVRDSKPSLALDALFTSSSDKEGHSVNLSDFGPFAPAYSNSNSGKAWGKQRDGNEDNGGDHKRGAAPIAVPEPGSLSLLLIGLAGIGVLAHRRRERQKAIRTARGIEKQFPLQLSCSLSDARVGRMAE